MLVVVATSVEEVGRDHDFDWGILSPETTRSVLQAAGRIRRHREPLATDEDANVLVLGEWAWSRPAFKNRGSARAEDYCRLDANKDDWLVHMDADVLRKGKATEGWPKVELANHQRWLGQAVDEEWLCWLRHAVSRHKLLAAAGTLHFDAHGFRTQGGCNHELLIQRSEETLWFNSNPQQDPP